MIIRCLLVSVFMLLSFNSVAERRSVEIATDYTWPRGSDKESECDLAKTGAKNDGRDIARKVGEVNIINIRYGECECKLGGDNKWGCKASATVDYWEVSGSSNEQHVKRSILKKYVNHIIPKYQQALGPLLKINGQHKLLAVLKGTSVLKYVNRFQGVLNRVQRAKDILDTSTDLNSNQFSTAASTLIKELDRAYDTMLREERQFNRLESSIIHGEPGAIEELERQINNHFDAKECIVYTASPQRMKNTCRYSVGVSYCAKSGKNLCNSKDSYYTRREYLKPNQSYDAKYAIQENAGIEFGACYVSRPSKIMSDGKYLCSNPYD